jgi:hypothetical protein
MAETLKREIQIDPAIGAIEIKITARAKDEDEVRESLESLDVEAQRREIWFYDTEGLEAPAGRRGHDRRGVEGDRRVRDRARRRRRRRDLLGEALG